MKYLPLILCLTLSGCGANWVLQWPEDGLKFSWSSAVGDKPQEVAIAEKQDDGPPKTLTKTASTTKTPVSDAEIQAETSRLIFGTGIALVLAGIGLMVARHYTMGIAIPSWVPRKVMVVGACVAVWGSVPSGTRSWIVGIIVVGGLLWMYYGSKNHNEKHVMKEERGKHGTSS